MMNAHEAMNAILDINETVEEMKSKNTDTTPDLLSCKAVELLIQYRELLVAEMKSTTLGVFANDDK